MLVHQTFQSTKAFTGEKWKPKVLNRLDEINIPPALSALLGHDDSTCHPHFDHCANCTKLLPKMNQCSRCKMVKYCSRDCQALHWKKVHKSSCVKAQPFSLYKCMNGNDGFHVSPEECQGLQLALAQDKNIGSDDVIRCLQAYFEIVADLGGCFIL